LILSLNRILRSSGALQGVWKAFKRTGEEWERESVLPLHVQGRHDGEEEGEGMQHHHQHQQEEEKTEEEETRERERQERLDEVNAELALLLAVLYFMVECFRGEEGWGEELSTSTAVSAFFSFLVLASKALIE
jgi:cation transport ATPase